jgi:hypothetical protein
MGSEVYAHFKVLADRVETDEVLEASGASDLSCSLRYVPNRLTLNDLVDIEVFARGWPISEARLRAECHHPLAPGLSLFTRVPYLKDSNLFR